jgi:lambda repressor-like predicted transcriptional regulator
MLLAKSGPMPVDTERRRRVMVELAKRGMTITDMARRVGCSQTYASAIINGRKRYPGCEQRIADTLNMPVDYLFPPRSQRELDAMRVCETQRQGAA